jgi:hypothetical protein
MDPRRSRREFSGKLFFVVLVALGICWFCAQTIAGPMMEHVFTVYPPIAFDYGFELPRWIGIAWVALLGALVLYSEYRQPEWALADFVDQIIGSFLIMFCVAGILLLISARNTILLMPVVMVYSWLLGRVSSRDQLLKSAGSNFLILAASVGPWLGLVTSAIVGIVGAMTLAIAVLRERSRDAYAEYTHV